MTRLVMFATTICLRLCPLPLPLPLEAEARERRLDGVFNERVLFKNRKQKIQTKQNQQHFYFIRVKGALRRAAPSA